MSGEVQCPYCGKPQEVNHDDGYGYEEDKLYQQECRGCEKTFAFRTQISFSHSAYKADCLNDGEHQYRLFGPVWLRCLTCGDEKPMGWQEREAAVDVAKEATWA